MSTSPEPARIPRRDDEIVSALSHWLAFHLGNSDLRTRLEAIGTVGLSSEQRAAIEELLIELPAVPEGTRGGLEMLVREALEAVALG